ncbi:MAG: hypothetical protein ACN6NZ_00950, partial [Burkholderiales bacterium]
FSAVESGRPSAGMPGSVKEFLKFLSFVWNFDRVNRPGIEAVRLAIGPQVPVVHLRSAQAVGAFVQDLSATAQGSFKLQG